MGLAPAGNVGRASRMALTLGDILAKDTESTPTENAEPLTSREVAKLLCGLLGGLRPLTTVAAMRTAVDWMSSRPELWEQFEVDERSALAFEPGATCCKQKQVRTQNRALPAVEVTTSGECGKNGRHTNSDQQPREGTSAASRSRTTYP